MTPWLLQVVDPGSTSYRPRVHRHDAVARCRQWIQDPPGVTASNPVVRLDLDCI